VVSIHLLFFKCWAPYGVSNPEMKNFSKVNEIKGLRGGLLRYAAQAIPPIDAEIGQKDHLWMENR